TNSNRRGNRCNLFPRPHTERICAIDRVVASVGVQVWPIRKLKGVPCHISSKFGAIPTEAVVMQSRNGVFVMTYQAQLIGELRTAHGSPAVRGVRRRPDLLGILSGESLWRTPQIGVAIVDVFVDPHGQRTRGVRKIKMI